MAAVAILIPLMRPQNLASVVDSISASTDDYHVVVMAATGPCADAARSLPVTLVEDDGGTWPQRINRGYKATTEPFICTGADDTWFMPGWFEAALIAMNALPNGSGVVGLNDCYNPVGNHFLMARDYVETLGGVMNEPGVAVCELYEHQYCDDDIRATANFHGRWAMAMDAKIDHRHVGRGMAPMDEIYQIGEATAAQGYAIFHGRAHLWERTPV